MSIMDDFECEVRGKVSEALAAMGAGDVQFPVEPSSVETVDLAVPCFTMSKAMRKAPQAIADELAAAIQPSGLISAVTSTNGYLNFNIDPTAMVKGVLDEIVERTLRQAALWDEVKDRLKRSALGLSGGQQQRLCIARALAVNPDVILMDEPPSALDPIAPAKIEDLVRDLKKDYTVVIVTHNMQQARRISDYTGFMQLGEMMEFGETKQIFEDPHNETTSKYIQGIFG